VCVCVHMCACTCACACAFVRVYVDRIEAHAPTFQCCQQHMHVCCVCKREREYRRLLSVSSPHPYRDESRILSLSHRERVCHTDIDTSLVRVYSLSHGERKCVTQGKLESRPTVTRLSLGCLILVRSLI